METKQCVYCGATKDLKEQTFIFQHETKVEVEEYICIDEKCLKTHSI